MERENTAQMLVNKKLTGKEKVSFPRGFWQIKSNVMLAVNSCKTLSEFHIKWRGASSSAKANNWIGDVRGKLSSDNRVFNGFWCKDKCKQKAIECETRTEYQTKYPSAYQAAMKSDWLDEFFGVENKSGRKKNKYWTIDRAANEAKLYSTRSELKKSCVAAYRLLRVNGLLDCACAHMDRGKPEIDCVYIWKVVSPVSGDNCYKIGVTSSASVSSRVYTASKSMGVEFSDYRKFNTGSSAREIEKRCLSFGIKQSTLTGSGSTEIRMLTKNQYDKVIEIMKSAEID